MFNQTHLLALTLSLLCPLAISPAMADEAEDEVDEVNAKSCIRVSSLRSTRIMDDQNIIFVMIGSKNYHNILPRQCHGLKREGRFSYETSTGSLCNIDNIRILVPGGSGLREGNSCRLGMFHPVSDADVDALMDKTTEPLQAEPIPLPEPENIGDGSEKTGNEKQDQ